MKKKIFAVILTLSAVISCLSISVSAADIRVFVDHVRIQFDVEPQLINNRTMVPLRAIFEAMGATVSWDGDTQTVTATKGSRTVVSTVGDTAMYVNGTKTEMDVAPMIVDNRTLVPARFVAEAFDCTVEWIENTKSVSITTNKDGKDGKDEKEAECYPDTEVPTYTAVTGVKMTAQTALQSGAPVYQYAYTADADFIKYTTAVTGPGWTVTQTDDPATENIYEFTVEKGDKYVIAYIFYDLKQVWIVCE